MRGYIVENIDFTTLKYPFFGDEIYIWNYDVTSGSWTAPENCFVVGKAVVQGDNSRAFIDVDGIMVAGIPYTTSGSMIQTLFCFPIAKGQTLNVSSGNNGRIQGMAARRMILLD